MNWILAGYFLMCCGIGMVMGAGSAACMGVSLPGFLFCGTGFFFAGLLLVPMRIK